MQVEDSYTSLLVRAYVSLVEGDFMSGDARVQQTMALALQRWWMLPEVGVSPQLGLLQTFQQLVEAKVGGGRIQGVLCFVLI